MMAFSGKGSGRVGLAEPEAQLLLDATRTEEKKHKVSYSVNRLIIHERHGGRVASLVLSTRRPSNFLLPSSVPWFSW